MQQATGALAQITFVEENQWGVTPPNPQTKKLASAQVGVQLKANVERLISNAINPARAIQAARGGNIGVSGQIPVEVPVNGLGTVFKHILGPVTSQAIAQPGFFGGLTKQFHTYKRGALPEGLSIEIGYTDINRYEVFNGCMIDKFSLTIGTQGFVTGTLDVKGKEMVPSDMPLSATPIEFEHIPFVHHEAIITDEAGVQPVVIEVVNMTLDIANTLSESRVVGNRYLASLVEGKGEATGTLTLLLKDATYINKVLNETESSLQVNFENEFGAFTLFAPKVKFFGDAGAGIPSNEGLVLAVEFVAIFSAAHGTDIQITLVNDEEII
jgi:Phage tail tube protein